MGLAILGILPALLWTYASVRRASRRRERQFVRWGSLLLWSLVATYLAALRTLPEVYAGRVFIAFCAAFLLVAGLLEWRRSRLREPNFPGSYLFSRSAPFGR
jgi:hypothetical protein